MSKRNRQVERVTAFEMPDKVYDVIQKIDELKLAIDRLDERKLKADLATANDQLNDIYHKIEIDRPDAVRMVRTYKTLQEVLRKRRIVKNQLSVIQSVCDSQCRNLFSNTDALRNTARKAYQKTEKIAC